MHYEYYEYMIILQIWTDLACAKTFNCYPWKKNQNPKYKNQTVPAQCNIIDKVLSEKSANDIIVGYRYSLFRKENQRVRMRRTRSSCSSVCAWVKKDVAWEDVRL